MKFKQRSVRRTIDLELYGWVINRSFAVSGTTDPVLCAKGLHETEFIKEIANGLSSRQTVVSPWVGRELNGAENLTLLTTSVQK